MEQIGELRLYVGTKEEYAVARRRGMKIVCALNRANGFITHQFVVGWQGRGCNPDNPYYLYKREEGGIYLNMIDSDNPKYIHDKMINETLDFIHHNLNDGQEVLIYCSLGESRSPSIALMYMLEYNLIEKSNETFDIFKIKYYPNFKPKMGNLLYIKNRWKI
jgi:hypothetical protein